MESTAQVEGTVSGKYGFVAAVPDVEKYGQGKIREGTGFATFDVTYFCIVMRPLKGEVMDCVVTSVNKVRLCITQCLATNYAYAHKFLKFLPHHTGWIEALTVISKGRLQEDRTHLQSNSRLTAHAAMAHQQHARIYLHLRHKPSRAF